ncbi:MAG: sugar transferase [Geminicoccaceae bacterium]|nr:sugar transferase [Geminicoccaceae bacterium]
MATARGRGIPVEQLPDLLRLHGGATDEFGAAIALVSGGSYRRTKRLADVVASAAVLVFLSPLLLVIACLIALRIGLPVVFHQVRPGQDMRAFRLYKFRTMRDVGTRDGRVETDAERTPAVGLLLRRLRVDELLQFWNVLRGDMTIIGPRPLLMQDILRFGDEGMERCRVRPGITGWAQVNGGHRLGPKEKLALDLWYVEHAGLALDLRIVLMTLRMMLLGERVNRDAIDAALAEAEPAKKAAPEAAVARSVA